MYDRCQKPRNPRYDRYGARGIRIDPEWRDFQAFAAWANANGYASNLTLDRINPDAGYSPENCQWILRNENSRKAVSDRMSQIARLKAENAELRARLAELESATTLRG